MVKIRDSIPQPRAGVSECSKKYPHGQKIWSKWFLRTTLVSGSPHFLPRKQFLTILLDWSFQGNFCFMRVDCAPLLNSLKSNPRKFATATRK